MATKKRSTASKGRRLFAGYPASLKRAPRTKVSTGKPTAEKDPTRAFVASIEKEMASNIKPNLILDRMASSTKGRIDIAEMVLNKTIEMAKKAIPGDKDDDTMSPEDQVVTTTIKPTQFVSGGQVYRTYKLKDNVKVSYNKYIRSCMERYPKTKVVLRDDMSGSPVGGVNANRQFFSVAGINRKGCYCPVIPFDTVTSDLWATGDFYPWEKGFYSPAFYCQDYNKMFNLSALLSYLSVKTMDGQDLSQTDIRLPLTKKRMEVTITNRNAYNPIDCIVYVFKALNPTTIHPAAIWRTAQQDVDVTGENTPAKYIYPDVNVDILYSGGATTNAQFKCETSFHKRCTPFMSEFLQDNYSVYNVHKFKLNPGDNMDYELSVETNGLSFDQLDSYSNGFSRQGLISKGDYALLIEFKGGIRDTAGYQQVTGDPAVYTYPKQLAVTNVTVPAEINVTTRITMECHMEDYYQFDRPESDRLAKWDGTSAWFTNGNALQDVQRIQDLYNFIQISKPRDYPAEFNVAYNDIKKAGQGGSSGYYIQTATDVTYKDVDSQGDKT